MFGWDCISTLGYPEDFWGHILIGVFGPILRASAWEAGGQPIAQRASCCLHRTFEHHPTAAYPHFPVPKIAALPRVHPPKLPMYSASRAAA